MPRTRSSLSSLVLIPAIFAAFLEIAQATDPVLPDLVPRPQLSADDVVRIQLDALANNDSPRADAGIEITYRFASPGNRELTGPLPRFIEMVKNPVYGPMVNHQGVEYGETVKRQGKVMIPVLLTAENGRKAAYIFVVGMQEEECEGCWMTEAVFPVPLNQLNPGAGATLELGV